MLFLKKKKKFVCLYPFFYDKMINNNFDEIKKNRSCKKRDFTIKKVDPNSNVGTSDFINFKSDNYQFLIGSFGITNKSLIAIADIIFKKLPVAIKETKNLKKWKFDDKRSVLLKQIVEMIDFETDDLFYINHVNELISMCMIILITSESYSSIVGELESQKIGKTYQYIEYKNYDFNSIQKNLPINYNNSCYCHSIFCILSFVYDDYILKIIEFVINERGNVNNSRSYFSWLRNSDLGLSIQFDKNAFNKSAIEKKSNFLTFNWVKELRQNYISSKTPIELIRLIKNIINSFQKGDSSQSLNFANQFREKIDEEYKKVEDPMSIMKEGYLDYNSSEFNDPFKFFVDMLSGTGLKSLLFSLIQNTTFVKFHYLENDVLFKKEFYVSGTITHFEHSNFIYAPEHFLYFSYKQTLPLQYILLWNYGNTFLENESDLSFDKATLNLSIDNYLTENGIKNTGTGYRNIIYKVNKKFIYVPEILAISFTVDDPNKLREEKIFSIKNFDDPIYLPKVFDFNNDNKFEKIKDMDSYNNYMNNLEKSDFMKFEIGGFIVYTGGHFVTYFKLLVNNNFTWILYNDSVQTLVKIDITNSYHTDSIFKNTRVLFLKKLK